LDLHLTSSIGIALVLFLIGMLIWKKCFSTTQSMWDTHSGTIGSTYADSQPTSNPSRHPGD
jgi:hypothetical protein